MEKYKRYKTINENNQLKYQLRVNLRVSIN